MVKNGKEKYSLNLGEDLVTVLDQLRIKYCIGIGDGAGSNIIVRFGMMHVTRCLGVILLNPTTNKVKMSISYIITKKNYLFDQ